MYILYDHISKIYYDYNIFFKSINGIINYNLIFLRSVIQFKYCPNSFLIQS